MEHVKNPQYGPGSLGLSPADATTDTMPEISTALLAGYLNKTIFLSALAVSAKLLSEGIVVAAVGLLLPLCFVWYLKHTDAALLR